MNSAVRAGNTFYFIAIYRVHSCALQRGAGNTFYSSFTPAGTSDTRDPYIAGSHPPHEGDDDDDDDDDDTASGPLPEEPEECFVLCLIRLLKICEPFKRRFGFLMPNTTIADGVLLMSTFRRHIL